MEHIYGWSHILALFQAERICWSLHFDTIFIAGFVVFHPSGFRHSSSESYVMGYVLVFSWQNILCSIFP